MVLLIPQLAGFHGHDFTLVAALLGALAALTPLAHWLYAKTIVVVLLVAVVAYTPVAERAARSLIRSDPLDTGHAPPGAVIVLGEDITPDSLLGRQALDRMLTGAALVQAGVAPQLVVTRNITRVHGHAVPSTPDQRRIASLAGIDSARMQVVDSVHSTRDEAVRAWTQLSAQGIRRVVVVTSPIHTGRACRTFQRAGFSVICRPAVSRDVPVTPGALHRSEDRLRAFGLWLYEQAAFTYYHLRGWI